MKIAFIGDIVGRPGRKIIKQNLKNIRDKYSLDFVIANGENASHGFGITIKNADELFRYGIDLLTGGNHSWDKKKDMLTLLETKPVLRPDNYPKDVAGSGVKIVSISSTSGEVEQVDIPFAVVNLMGIVSMPQVLNPFTHAVDLINNLKADGINHIFIDFHAEVTAEKRVMMQLLQSKVSAICGTHTHIGTDDLEITNGTFYVTDVGLTGCRDNVIGMDKKVPCQKALTGLGGHFDVPNSCKSIMQIMIIELDENGQCIDGFKIKLYDDKDEVISKALIN